MYRPAAYTDRSFLRRRQSAKKALFWWWESSARSALAPRSGAAGAAEGSVSRGAPLSRIFNMHFCTLLRNHVILSRFWPPALLLGEVFGT